MSNTIKTFLNSEKALINSKEYEQLYSRSIDDPEDFWAEQAKKYLKWNEPWKRVLTGNLREGNVRWFAGAKINVCENCLDRHLSERANQTAIIWEGDDPKQTQRITYQYLYEQVCQLANGLKAIGIMTGDRVCIYMPVIPEAVVAMLACARIGAVHSVVFAGFSAESLKKRVQDASCKVIITADGNQRAGKNLSLKENVDEVVEQCETVKNVIVCRYTKQAINMYARDIWYHDLIANLPRDCPLKFFDATDPLFILYTSGSTGRPKGVLHGQGGYLLYATMTFQLIFNYQTEHIYWCTADIGWITGHSYLVYGPLSSGATLLMFAGVPTYPSVERYWQIIEKHRVNIFYTAPTALRALMREGDEPIKRHDLSSLKMLGTVGEPINPDVWIWYFKVIGEERCPIVDTWWQTETGGIMISALPYAMPLKPGSACKPFFGIKPEIVDDNLVIAQPWPGQLQTIYRDKERLKKTYFSEHPGFYTTGDAARCDEEGYFWITGRTDDVINVSGHRLDSAEIESALVAHDVVAEAAVVGFPHEIKGQGIYAYVIPKVGAKWDETTQKELIQLVRKKISPIATPDSIQWVNDLPKTRSGKIMRRILRKIVAGEKKDFGDTSTLANPEVITKIITH